MELNDPITLGGEYHFCEVGNQLALQYLQKAHEVLALIYSEDVFDLKRRVDAGLIPLAKHVDTCPDCNEN